MNAIEAIRNSLSTNDREVERAMVLLYAMQTADEKATKTTRETNGRGFTYYDARKGSYYARWIIGCERGDDDTVTAAKMRDYLTHGFRQGINRPLTGRFLTDARHRSMKYAGQLLRIAEAVAPAPVPAPVPFPSPPLPEPPARFETQIGTILVVTGGVQIGEGVYVTLREGDSWVFPQLDVRFMLCEWAPRFGETPLAKLSHGEYASMLADLRNAFATEG